VGITAELAHNIVATRFDAFDLQTLTKARNLFIDVLGCAVAGTKASGSGLLLDLMAEWGGTPQSTVLGTACKLPSHHAAMVNSVLARSYDFEPTGALIEGKSTPSHISGTTVPVALSVGEWVGASGKDTITALVLGDDLAARLAAASHLDIDSGWDSTGTVNAFGAAAVAGRLLGLDEDQMARALGIALNQLAGTFLNIFESTHSFKLPQGLAAQAGVFSAVLAQRGFTAPREPLTDKNGYFSLYCRNHDAGILGKDLGRRFYSGDTFKPFPCCRSNHAAIECTLALVEEHGIRAENVSEIIVSVTPTAKAFAVGQPFEIGDVPQINAAFSLQYTVANALVRKGVRLEHFTEDFIREPVMAAVVKKVTIDSSLPREIPLGAAVTIRTTDGREYEKRIEMARGRDTLTPLSPEEKIAKFRSNVAFAETVPQASAERALELLEHLEDVENVAEIAESLTPR
jgi:2-methylcitrate dehydratase PrpD